MNQIVFTEPERTGFAPINLRSENFNFAPSWRAFQARLARSQGEQSLRGSLDWSVLEELNQEASRLWQEMLACENNDSEAARRNYYLANPCGGSRPDL